MTSPPGRLAPSFSSRQKTILAALATAVGFRTLGLFLVLPVFTLYGLQFTRSPFWVGVAFGCYGMAVACAAIPMGRLSDRIGRRKVLILGMAVFSAGSFLCALPPWFPATWRLPELVFGRFIQGLGTITSTAFATVADHIPTDRRSTGLAILGIPIGAAFIVGVVGGPLLAGWLNTQSIFWVTGVLALVSVAWLARSLPEVPAPAIAPRPISEVLRGAPVIALDFGGFMMNVFMTAFWFYFPLIMTGGHHVGVGRYYRVLLPMVLVSGITMFGFSRGADRGWGKGLAAFAFLLLAASALMLFRPGIAGLSPSRLAAVFVPGTLFLVGFTGLEPILPNLVSQASHESAYGTALGSFQTLQYLGSFTGGALAGALSHLPSFYPMTVLIVASVIGFLLMLSLRKAWRLQASSSDRY